MSSNSFKGSYLLLECFSLALSVRESGNLTSRTLFDVLPLQISYMGRKTSFIVIVNVAIIILLSFGTAIGTLSEPI